MAIDQQYADALKELELSRNLISQLRAELNRRGDVALVEKLQNMVVSIYEYALAESSTLHDIYEDDGEIIDQEIANTVKMLERFTADARVAIPLLASLPRKESNDG